MNQKENMCYLLNNTFLTVRKTHFTLIFLSFARNTNLIYEEIIFSKLTTLEVR